MDQLPRLGKRELICLLLFTCNFVVSVWRGFLFLWVLGMGYVILFWHSLSISYNYFEKGIKKVIDILDANGDIYNFEQLKETYSLKGTFLDYQELISKLPRTWLEAINEQKR